MIRLRSLELPGVDRCEGRIAEQSSFACLEDDVPEPLGSHDRRKPQEFIAVGFEQDKVSTASL